MPPATPIPRPAQGDATGRPGPGRRLRPPAATLALLALAACDQAPAAATEPAAQSVAVAAVERRAVERTVRGDGTVAAWQELVIGAESGGLRVLEVVEEGEAVRRGQVLVRLDDTLLRAQAAQAAAAAAEAEANFRLAGAELRRAQELQRGEFAARQTLEQRQAATAGAEARLAAARAQRDDADARLTRARILAPHDGTVSRRSILPGAVVVPGQELVRLVRDGRIELGARVPELDLVGVAPGQPARVRHGGREVAAVVRAVAPVIAAETRLGTVHLTLPPDSGLRPGMFARADIVVGRVEAPVLPRAALVHRDGRPVAFVLDAGGAAVALRRLELGPAGPDGAPEVRAGLEAGERVVVAGAGFLGDGDRVRVVEALAAAPAPAPAAEPAR